MQEDFLSILIKERHQLNSMTEFNLNTGTADNVIRIYPTLRCNMRCTYCSNGLDKPRIPEASAKFWVDGLKRLPNPKQIAAVHITGGEPFLYPYLTELVNAVPVDNGVMLYTNLTVPPKKFINGLKRKLSIRGSIHYPINAKEVKENIIALNNSPYVDSVSIVFLKESAAKVEYYKHFIRIPGISIAETNNQWGLNEKTAGIPKEVACTNRIWLFGPDGYRNQCIHHMREGIKSKERFNDIDWNVSSCDITVMCKNFGCCCACDGLIDSSAVTL